nr:hypothetical protein [Tanacetum cinerariifolium]
MPSHFHKKFRWGTAVATGRRCFIEPRTRIRMKRTNRRTRVPIGLYPCHIEKKMTIKVVKGESVMEWKEKVTTKEGIVIKLPGKFRRNMVRTTRQNPTPEPNPDIAAIIAQQLQNILSQIVAQVTANVKNTNGGYGNDRNNGCSYKTFTALTIRKSEVCCWLFCEQSVDVVEHPSLSERSGSCNWFHELAKLVPHLVTPKSLRIKSDILTARILTDEVVRCGTLTKGNDKRKEIEESSKQGSTWKDNKKDKTGSGFVATIPPKNKNVNTYPKYAKCYTFHPENARCKLCYNCQKLGHFVRQCWAPIRQVMPINAVKMGQNQRACYECGSLDHLRYDYLKWKQATRQARDPLALEGNKNTRNNRSQARGKAFNGNVVEALQDPKVVTEPCIINPGYFIEIDDGKSVEVDRVIRDCKLELENSLFAIDLIPLGHGSFDMVVGMDWLSKNKAVIVCHEKVVEIPIKEGGILRVHVECIWKAAKPLMNAKVDEPRISDTPVVQDFTDLFPEDLSGLPPQRQVEFRIEIVPGASPVAKSPYLLAPSKKQELSGQLQELQDKGFIQPSHSPWEAPVLFMKKKDRSFFTSNSVSTPQEPKVVKNDKVIAPGMFRIKPDKTSREAKNVPNTVRASNRTKPITISQPPVFTKKDVNSDLNGLSSTEVDNTKTRRPQPRSNTQSMIGSPLRLRDVISKVICAMCKQCLISVNYDVCLHHYVNGKKSHGNKQKAKVSVKENQKKYQPKVTNVKKVGFLERFTTPKPRKPRFLLSWSPTGRLFDQEGKIVDSSKSESQSDCSNGDNACCSNHITGNLKLLINFVWKFMGTVHFRNDHVAAILGFGDLQWGNILITRVYFVEGLPKFKYNKEHLCPSCEQGKSKRVSHPPKPVPNSRQRLHLLHMDLCGPMRIASINGKRITVLLQSPVIIIRTDNDTEFKNQVLKEYFDTAIATACFTQNRSIIYRRFNKTPYELINGKKPNISFLHVFGALCYPKKDREDIGKLGAKGDIGFFIGYSADSCAYIIYNRRTKKIMETMNVSFDELLAMAFEQHNSKPGLQSMTSGQISSGLDLTYAPSTITTQQPTEGELDLLFEAMYDDYIGGQPSTTARTDVDKLNSNAMVDGNTFVNPFANSSTSAAELSSSQNVDPSNMHTFYQPYPHEFQWTKDHSLEQVIGEPSRPVLTRNQLPSDGDMCMYALTVSPMEPKNVKEAMTDPTWIDSMQEELLQFKRLDVWVLVPTPYDISHLTLKWLFKNKHDEEQTVIRNKSRLVMRGYHQEEGIDFKESFTS